MGTFFVYGTLMNGERLHPYLSECNYIGPALTSRKYLLLNLGAFPAMFEIDNEDVGQKVSGELYEVDEDTVSHLDYIEGHPHLFERLPIELEEGTIVTSYLMPEKHLSEFDAQTVYEMRIDSGDWRKRTPL